MYLPNSRISVDSKDPPRSPLRSEVGPGYVLRALVAIDLLARQPMTAGELSDALGVHRRTAVRLIDVMRDAGWIEPEGHDGAAMQLSTRVVTVAGEVIRRTNLIAVGSPFVRRLRDVLGESGHLAVPTDGWAVQIIEVPSLQPLAVTQVIGQRVPMYCSAVGKAIMAFRPDQLEITLANGLARHTPSTLATPAALAAELEQVRRVGFAIDDAELYPAICCVAAPIRNGLGEVVGAIGVSGPAVRVTHDRIAPMAGVVVEEANGLSEALGYRSPTAAVISTGR